MKYLTFLNLIMGKDSTLDVWKKEYLKNPITKKFFTRKIEKTEIYWTRKKTKKHSYILKYGYFTSN